jgi:hypothetical protein
MFRIWNLNVSAVKVLQQTQNGGQLNVIVANLNIQRTFGYIGVGETRLVRWDRGTQSHLY